MFQIFFFWREKVRNVRFMRVQPWHPHCPPGISLLFALKWFANHTCIIFSNTFHMLTVGTLCTTVCINYVLQFRLWPYIIYLILNLLHYLIKSYFYHYYSPQIVLSFVGLSSSSSDHCVMFLHWIYSALMLQEGVTSICLPQQDDLKKGGMLQLQGGVSKLPSAEPINNSYCFFSSQR